MDYMAAQEYVTPRQFAAMTGRSEQVVRSWCRDRVIPAGKVGRLWLIPRDAVPVVPALPTR